MCFASVPPFVVPAAGKAAAPFRSKSGRILRLLSPGRETPAAAVVFQPLPGLLLERAEIEGQNPDQTLQEIEAALRAVELVNLPSDWCSRSFIDESKLTDIDEQMQQAFAEFDALQQQTLAAVPPYEMPVADLRSGTWVTSVGGHATGVRGRRCRVEVVAARYPEAAAYVLPAIL